MQGLLQYLKYFHKQLMEVIVYIYPVQTRRYVEKHSPVQRTAYRIRSFGGRSAEFLKFSILASIILG